GCGLRDASPLGHGVPRPASPLPPNGVVVPAFTGELLGAPAALHKVRLFLTNRPVTGVAELRTTAEIMAAAASAWRMPESTAPSPPCGARFGLPDAANGKR